MYIADILFILSLFYLCLQLDVQRSRTVTRRKYVHSSVDDFYEASEAGGS